MGTDLYHPVVDRLSLALPLGRLTTAMHRGNLECLDGLAPHLGWLWVALPWGCDGMIHGFHMGSSCSVNHHAIMRIMSEDDAKWLCHVLLDVLLFDR